MELERSESEHCLEGSHGIEIVETLTPSPRDYVKEISFLDFGCDNEI